MRDQPLGQAGTRTTYQRGLAHASRLPRHPSAAEGAVVDSYVAVMPIVDVTYAPDLKEERLVRLAQTLPQSVSVAVECPEEPYDRNLRPGDVEVRFRQRGAYDLSGLDILVEVRSKWFESRAKDRQERADHLRDALVEAAGTRSIGVYLSLPVASWSQGE
jgi:hypothetical protein